MQCDVTLLLMDHGTAVGAKGTSVLKGPADSDPCLLDLVRQGDADAFDTLYKRHLQIALYVARQQTDNQSDADDVVAEAFASVFQSLKDGKGPKEFFRPYLLTVVRRTAHDRNRKARRMQTTEDALLDTAVLDDDTVMKDLESSIMAKAFKSLPERWQAVLWHMDIEGLKPAAVAPLVGLTPNGVSSLAIRAREGLRQAYLQHHITTVADEACAEFAGQMGKYARNALKRTSREKVNAHLEGCARCTALLIELNDVQGGMRAILFPLFTGITFTPGVAAAVLSGSGAGAGAVGSLGSLSGSTAVPVLSGPGGSKGAGHLWKPAAAVVLAAVVAAGALGWILQPASQSVVAEPPPAAPAVETPTPVATPVPVPTVPQPSPSAPPAEVPAVPAPPAAPEQPAVVVAQEPALQRKATVVDSAVVTSVPVPQPSSPTSPLQTVEAVFASTTAANAVERNLEVQFSLVGDGSPTAGEAVFTLPDQATFISGRTLAPAGWECSATGARQVTCTSRAMDPAQLNFAFGVTMPATSALEALDYGFSGQDIVTKTFASTFH